MVGWGNSFVEYRFRLPLQEALVHRRLSALLVVLLATCPLAAQEKGPRVHLTVTSEPPEGFTIREPSAPAPALPPTDG